MTGLLTSWGEWLPRLLEGLVTSVELTAAGQLRYQASGAVTLIEGEVNGDGAADFRIQVNIANYSFSAFDFVL